MKELSSRAIWVTAATPIEFPTNDIYGSVLKIAGPQTLEI